MSLSEILNEVMKDLTIRLKSSNTKRFALVDEGTEKRVGHSVELKSARVQAPLGPSLQP